MSRAPSSAALTEGRWLMRAGVDPVDAPRLRAMATPGLDWARLLALAEYERAFPILADRLRDAAFSPPPAIEAQLRARATVAEFASARLHAILDQVVAQLAGAHIDVLLLKGAALARTRYAAPRLRPMGDLDLLIGADQLTRAWELLVAAGWRSRAAPPLDAFYREHQHLPPLHDPRGAGATIELHGELFRRGNPFRFGADAIWRDARQVPLGAVTAWVPSASHLLLHACIHFAWGHTLREGAWNTFRDVSVLAASGELDWDAFIRDAEAARGATASYWTLRLASQLVDAGVPPGVLSALAPRMPRPVRDRLGHHFAVRLLGGPSAASRVERALWELAIAPEASGHGAVRPWDLDELFLAGQPDRGEEGDNDRLAMRLRRRLRAVQASARCLRELALAPSADR